jgi:hypothetical protein
VSGLTWIQYTDRMTGRNHPTLPDTLNAALRKLLTDSGYNADATTFPGLFGPVYNVRAFGAVGDGVTDDSAAFAAAIAAAGAVGTSDTVYIPEGTYVCSFTLPTDVKVRLLGDGCDITVLKAPAGVAFVINSGSTHASGGWHCELRDVSINGNAQAGPAVTISGMTKFFMSRVRIFNCQGTGLKVYSCWDCMFFDVFVSGTGGDVGVTASPVILDGITGNETDECSFYRLHIEPGATNQIYLDLQGQNANCVRYCDFYYLKCAGNYTTGAPNNNPLMRVGANANDNVVIGGTMAYCNGAPQVQISGSRNRFCYISHVAGVAFPTFAYSVLAAANDNEVVGPSITSSSYTSGWFNVANTASRTRILGPIINVAQANIIVDAANTQTYFEQPRTRVGVTGSGTTLIYNAAVSTLYVVTVSATPNTMGVPTNSCDGMEVDVQIFNNTGGAIVTTWTGGAGGWNLGGAWVDPASGKRRYLRARYNGNTNRWDEVSRTAADI